MSTAENMGVLFDAQGQLHWQAVPSRPPQPDEVEVAVSLASVNPIDVKRRRGYGRKVFSLKGANPKQLALGNDFVGSVNRVGAQVIGFKAGDRVFGVKPPSRHGPHAQRLVVKVGQLHHAESTLSDELLVTLPYNACTVLRAFEAIGLQASNAHGKRVLVAGAGGGLGSIALGFLHQWGADVTAIDRPANHARCIALGAAQVCTDSDLPSMQGTFDAVLNFATWELDAALCRTLRAGALGYATTVHPLLSLLDQKGLLLGALAIARARRRGRRQVPQGARYAWALFSLKDGDLAAIQEFARVTQPVPLIGLRAPMSEAGLAFDHVEQMQPGRAVLTNSVSGEMA